MADEGFAVETFSGKGKSPWSLAAIRRHVRQARPDVLHCNDAHALTAAGLASIGLAIPVRAAARRVDFPIRSRAKYERWSDCVICVSTAVARVCRAGGISEERLHVVHDGVDPQRMSSGVRSRGRQSLSCMDDEVLLLCVAKLTDHKGHRFLLDAMPTVLARIPRVRLALAGDGELTESLKQQATELGIAAHVDFLGFRDDVPDLIAACDLFVISSHLEGLCSSIVDGMFASRPIVATRAGGIPDLMGETFAPELPVGWTAPTKDPALLAETIVEASGLPEERKLRCRRAFDRAQRLFTADTMVDRTLEVYRQCIERRAVAAA
jgi:glycosyltransferase involved in cell wall biosynthesis